MKPFFTTCNWYQPPLKDFLTSSNIFEVQSFVSHCSNEFYINIGYLNFFFYNLDSKIQPLWCVSHFFSVTTFLASLKWSFCTPKTWSGTPIWPFNRWFTFALNYHKTGHFWTKVSRFMIKAYKSHSGKISHFMHFICFLDGKKGQ